MQFTAEATRRRRADAAEHLDDPWGTQPRLLFHVPAPRSDNGAAGDVVSLAVVRAWAADSGEPLSQFQHTYFESNVADLMDQHAGMRRHDAECVALDTMPWLDDRAA